MQVHDSNRNHGDLENYDFSIPHGLPDYSGSFDAHALTAEFCQRKVIARNLRWRQTERINDGEPLRQFTRRGLIFTIYPRCPRSDARNAPE